MRLSITALFIASIYIVYGNREIKYAVRDIPANLRKDANVVIRKSNSSFRILSKSKAVHRTEKAYTILNEQGKKFALEVIGYDNLSKISSFSGTLYDSSGQVIKKVNLLEMHDQSAVSGFSLYEDNRLKWYDLSYGVYPYTVEFESEVNFKFLFYIPTFMPIQDEKMSLQEALYSLEFSNDWNLAPRYKLQNISANQQKIQDGGVTKLQWRLHNILAIEKEPLAPPLQKQLPAIYAAPTTFEFDDYDGTMKTWNGFGEWISKLNINRDQLPPETKKQVKELTSDLNSTEEKAKVLYEYLQNKTRYVSIQVGIGGFQPFEAKVVDEAGYGDCKALSNYMVALLKEAGVKAFYTLIRAGADASEIESDFPSTQFNHAIAFVPTEKDTLWLECTSQTNPFGYLGTFTYDRNALAITEDGAKIIKTRDYSSEENLQSRTASVVIDAAGNGIAKVATTYKGLQYENGNLNFILDDRLEDQKSWILKNTPIPNFTVLDFKTQTNKSKIPSARIDLDLDLRKLGSQSGKRLFLNPNLLNRSTYIPENFGQRKTEIQRRFGYMDIDTIYYTLPDHFRPEAIPSPTTIRSRFGEYDSSVKVDAGKVVYIRRVKINKGTFPPPSYTELIDFYRNISKADNIKLVFVSKT
ncbi:MAG: DUF3857 domain-containing transglutaminase family protein [Cyclobacteriaceae bacterium]|nr:DUF3857 domain-containing transglutaminase family protein [Cyclobacteriaceae bacterium]